MKEVIEGKMRLSHTCEVLGLSYRQILRLKKRFLYLGFEGLLRQNPEKPPNLKVTDEIREKIIELRKNLYWDFNILHFKEKLQEHEVFLSYESIRKVLIENGIHEPKLKYRWQK